MTPKNQKASTSDIYESAWAALDAENQVFKAESLRADGWKSVQDFDGNYALYQRLARSSNVERRKFKVSRPAGIRNVTFFRPKL
jgi:hypothetical protein